MRDRLSWAAVLVIGLLIPLSGCSNPSGLDSIQLSPTTQSLAAGQTAQFTVMGTYGNGNHAHAQAVSTGVTWTSSAPTVATISSSGLATAVGAGTTTITASANAFNGPVSSSATITVTASGGGGGGGVAGGSIASISVIPSAQSVASPGQTSQFIAIGTTSSAATVDLTSQVVWSSSSPQIATIGATTGLATAVGQGTVTITARYSSTTSGTTVTGTATFTVSSGNAQQYSAVSITPGSESLSAAGQTGQFIALATSGSTGLLVDVTSSSQIKWSSSSPSIATVNATGLATGVSQGSSTITAELTNSDGSVVSGTATVSVTLTSAAESLLSLTIIPNSITVGNLQGTGQFLAIGTFSTSPTVRDLTNSVTWISTAPNVFPVDTNTSGSAPGGQGVSGGVVSAFGTGNAVIVAEATDPATGSIQTATATFACPLVLPTATTPGTCYPGSQASALLSTLTVYNMGLNTTNWEITAPSATGTPNVLHCGPGWALNGGVGGSVCTATYPVGTTVTVTAPAGAGAFGGWSDNCAATQPVTAAGPNSCTVSLTSDDTVGAIFN